MLNCRIWLISGVVLLSGCAGMNSEFEFGKPAKDSGYWMSEADEMTDTASHSTVQHKGEVVKMVAGGDDLSLLVSTGITPYLFFQPFSPNYVTAF